MSAPIDLMTSIIATAVVMVREGKSGTEAVEAGRAHAQRLLDLEQVHSADVSQDSKVPCSTISIISKSEMTPFFSQA